MHPIKTKSKSKLQTKGKKNTRFGKFLTNSTHAASRPDLSSLRKPIDTSVSDLYQVSGLLEDGTDEVKSILSYECNIIYECRVCHSLFRSIMNLVSHKREYCREKFDITLHRRVLNNVHSARELIYLYKTEQTSNNGVKNDRILRSQVSKEPNKKDLTAIIDMLNKRQEEYVEKQLEKENASNVVDDRNIYLETIDTNCSAVYQTVESSDTVIDDIDLMKEQIKELQNMDQNAECVAVKEQTPENQFEKSDNPIQANDEENELLINKLPMNNLSCSICNAKFSTKKTLTVHVKTLHTSKRLCYPCPCCTNIFANTWSVYRHLYKVHKKTNEQVRKLRLQIQEKAFHRKTSAMRGIKSVSSAKVSALKNVTENNSQKPISRVGRHGRRSKRKASLPTYLEYCQTPIAAYDETTVKLGQCNILSVSFDDVQYETEDVNLVPNTIIKSSDVGDISNKNSECTSSSFEISDHETSIHVQDISSLNKEDWDILANQHNHLSERNSMDNNNDPDIISPENTDDSKLLLSPAENQDTFVSDKNLKSPSIVCTDANEVSSAASKMRKEKALDYHNETRLIDSKERDKIEVKEDNSELQSFSSTQSNEKNRTSLMESKMAIITDLRKLRCLLCRRKFTSIPNLRRHVAIHIGWNRYRCKLCDFKCFVKCECVAHCNKVHNMQNNRTSITEIILEIPQSEYACNENVADETDSGTKSDNPDITVAVTAASCQPETHVNSNDSSDLDTHVISQSEATAGNERVAESRASVECQNIDTDNSDRTEEIQDPLEYMMNCKKLDDFKLKQLVMEVILGPTDTIEADSDKPSLKTSDDASRYEDMNENINDVETIGIDEAFCMLNNVKHQRPRRNRIKPLSNDFIYDLKKATYRKKSALINNSEILHIKKKAKLYN